jgi:CBS domain-containing protein
MSRDPLVLPQAMPLREAARLLQLHRISGAPVVEPGGTCVGVLSVSDLLRWTNCTCDDALARERYLPKTCQFQIRERGPDGEERVRCLLVPGICTLQRTETGLAGEELVYCTEPHAVLTDWQMVNVEQLPTEEVSEFMTADPVLVTADTPVPELARYMIDAHIHRLIVVDGRQVPIGVVSSTDILALVARAGRHSVIEEPAPV